jgi:hypothetical protein
MYVGKEAGQRWEEWSCPLAVSSPSELAVTQQTVLRAMLSRPIMCPDHHAPSVRQIFSVSHSRGKSEELCHQQISPFLLPHR